jgi:hypothetical protein
MHVNHRALVIASRTALVMLMIAAAVLLALGAASLLLSDPPETGGWLRAIFGRVFGITALALAAILGVPSGAGLWAMAGANAEGTVASLGRRVRLVFAATAIGTTVITAVVCLASGTGVLLLNLGLIGIVALAALGLGGAVSFSPQRWRAIVAFMMLILVAVGSLTVLVRAFLILPG